MADVYEIVNAIKNVPKSEFGRGLVICLMKFSEHSSNDMARQIYDVHSFYNDLKGDEVKLKDQSARFQINVDSFKGSIKIYGTVEKALASLIEMWASGASDHLYDIEVPDQWKDSYLARKVSDLQHFGLEIGHGFTGKAWMFKDFQTLMSLTKEIAQEIDLLLGIEDSDWGEC